MANPGEVELSLVDYSRQAAFEQEAEGRNWNVKRQAVVIVGCGGIGFWLGLQLAMTGMCKSITVFDKEKIEPSNLNRLPVPQTWVGKAKVLCFKHIVHMMRPELPIVPVMAHVTEDTKGVLKTLLTSEPHGVSVYDCTDDARAQKMIYDLIKETLPNRNNNINYVKAGYEGHKIGAVRVLNAWIPADYRPGYRTTNANAVTSAVAAGMAIYKMLFGSDVDFNMDLKKTVEATKEVGIRKRRPATGAVAANVRGAAVPGQPLPSWSVSVDEADEDNEHEEA